MTPDPTLTDEELTAIKSGIEACIWRPGVGDQSEFQAAQDGLDTLIDALRASREREEAQSQARSEDIAHLRAEVGHWQDDGAIQVIRRLRYSLAFAERVIAEEWGERGPTGAQPQWEELRKVLDGDSGVHQEAVKGDQSP